MSRRHLTSRDNAHYKEWKLLATSAQARRKAGQSLLDGVHLCVTYLEQLGQPLCCIVGESALANQEVQEIVASCEQGGADVVSLPDNLFAPLSQVEHGIDVLFVVNTPSPTVPAQLRLSSVLLDQVQDPGNLGSVLRSAAAAGIRQVYCAPGTAQAWSPKVLRAGMGAHFVVDIFENVDLASLIESAEIPVLATSSHTAQVLYDLDLTKPVAWLFGHEGKGVDPALLAAASSRVAIPHLGNVESLNVAASAAVCFFEQVRQQTRSQH
ncbi:RNA methyltransferase [uncultured Oxalicibacterium sp.]|uniref:TrmH family RNA methyltransferase n=1 Tax=uncultured Oxalicibacterium sp. TaxID=1168540 RepID=UPI0025F42E68|nr:RNA methyltransferase [uncultured Oxalicibacterium sp.]